MISHRLQCFCCLCRLPLNLGRTYEGMLKWKWKSTRQWCMFVKHSSIHKWTHHCSSLCSWSSVAAGSLQTRSQKWCCTDDPLHYPRRTTVSQKSPSCERDRQKQVSRLAFYSPKVSIVCTKMWQNQLLVFTRIIVSVTNLGRLWRYSVNVITRNMAVMLCYDWACLQSLTHFLGWICTALKISPRFNTT